MNTKRHQLLINWMKRTYDRYRYETVKIVSLPIPPTPVDGVLFMPDSFCSKVFDNPIETDAEFKIAMVKHTKFGPAMLIYAPFGELISFDAETGYLEINAATYCARVSYYVLCESNGFKYADEVVIDSISSVSRSCHPGSHYIVPHAPHLTALLQYSQAPSLNDNRKLIITYLTPDEGEKLFPHCIFDTNKFVDDFVARCVVDDQVSFYKTLGGLGEWSSEILRRLRRNILEGNYYGGHELLGDACKEDGGKLGNNPDSAGDDVSIQAEWDRDHAETGREVGGGSQSTQEGTG